jgi:hypothetical protein
MNAFELARASEQNPSEALAMYMLSLLGLIVLLLFVSHLLVILS